MKSTNNQKIVVKEFAEGYRTIREIEGVSGHTIMGNGKINLIVDDLGVSAYGDGGGGTNGLENRGQQI